MDIEHDAIEMDENDKKLNTNKTGCPSLESSCNAQREPVIKVHDAVAY